MARKSRKGIEAATAREVQKTVYSAGAYIRLSVIDRKNKGDSIENQQAIINSFIAGQDDIELRECYIDNGHSGQSFERPAFLRMIADIENGKINCCITKDLSRLGRNAIDSGFYIERYFPETGVRYIAVTDDYDSVNGQSGGIMLSLKNMINEAYALDASRKVKATIHMNIRKGNFVGAAAPYGYIKDSGNKHKLIIDERVAPVILRMFEMAAEGRTYKEILNWLNNSGILPPMRYLCSIGAVSRKKIGADKQWWSFGAVCDILSNRMYCGDMVQGKHKVINTVNTRVPESDWVIIENTHEAIVSRDLFEAVQKILPKRDNAEEPYYKSPKTENIFARKVFCGHCGYRMVRHRGSEKSYGYVCNTRNLYTQQVCGGMRITENVMKTEMLKLIRRYEPRLVNLMQPLTDDVPEADDYKKELASAQSEYDRTKRFLEGLYESLVNGDISDAEYKDMKEVYETKITALTGQIKRLREIIHIRAEQNAMFAEARENVRKLEQISDLTAEVIDKLVDRITVFPGKRIEVKFNFLEEPVSNIETGGRGV